MPDFDVKLDSTLKILASGLSGMAPETARHNIETWESDLQAAGRPELTNIARDLAALRTHLAGDLDGVAIGKLLLRLGQQTTTVAGRSSDGDGGDAVHAKLHHLGDLLTKAGSVLAPNAHGSTAPHGEPGPSGATLAGTGATASGLGTESA